MKTNVLSQGLLLGAISCMPLKAEWSLDLESGAVWNSKADVRIPNSGGTFFSLNGDLRERDPRAYFRGRATWHLGNRHDVSLLYAPLEMDFRGRFGRPVVFGGGNFLANTPTEGSYRFDSYRITYRYNFVSTERFVFGLGLTAKIRDAEVSLSQAGISKSDSNTGFVPLINYRVFWKFMDRFSLLSEGDALGASQGYAVDASAAIQWHATDRFALRVGYRILDGGADSDSVYTFSRFHYSVFGASYTF
jgi:hypothetical protein